MYVYKLCGLANTVPSTLTYLSRSLSVDLLNIEMTFGAVLTFQLVNTRRRSSSLVTWAMQAICV